MGGKKSAPAPEPIPDPAAPRAENATASVSSLVAKVRKRNTPVNPAAIIRDQSINTPSPGANLGSSKPLPAAKSSSTPRTVISGRR